MASTERAVAALALVAMAGSAPPGSPAAARGEPGTLPDTAIVRSTDRLTYEPAEVRVPVGATVVWENASVLVHTVTADPAEATLPGSVRLPEGAAPFDSGTLAPGEDFAHTFIVAGRYRYFCIPHEGARMRGTVVVGDAGTSRSPESGPPAGFL